MLWEGAKVQPVDISFRGRIKDKKSLNYHRRVYAKIT